MTGGTGPDIERVWARFPEPEPEPVIPDGAHIIEKLLTMEAVEAEPEPVHDRWLTVASVLGIICLLWFLGIGILATLVMIFGGGV